MSVLGAVARQLGRPSGRLGSVVGVVLNRANRRINRVAVEALDVVPDHRVLDIGFGGGVALGLLDKIVSDGLLAGVEISDTMLQRGRRRFRRQIEGGGMTLEHAAVADLPFADESFDRVITVNTIYFWPDPGAGLREIGRVLRPGGRLALVTRPKERFDESRLTRHGFRFYGEDELGEMLGAASLPGPRFERHGSDVLVLAEKS